MAHLIPSFMDERTPPGERDVFNLLAAGPDDWVALHSLDLAPWNRSLRTEIDFVVIAPDVGIVCLEVKSHENITFDGLRWFPETIARSPFKQAADGRHEFYRRLVELAPHFRRVPIVHCCIFPKSPFDLPVNLSVQPWELMDSRTFRSFANGAAFCNELKTRIKLSIAADANLSPLAKPLSRDQIDMLVKCCLPVQKRRPGAREEISRRQEEMERLLRDQQKPVLHLTAMNARVIVSGGAGTGKTLIAMEVARRAAESGRRVAFLCFNQLVGDWVSRRMEQESGALPNLVAGRAIRIMARLTGLEIPKNPSAAYWETELPGLLEERLTDPDLKAVAAFDYLVLDEAQDLLARPHLWECVPQFLLRGLDQGSFALFGDFDNQVFAEKIVMQQTLSDLESAVRPTSWRLTENCRNYQIVGDTAVCLSGLDKSVYTGYLRAGGGVQNYDISFYEHERAQLDKLDQWLQEFRAKGYKPSEITLLSFRSEETSAALRLRNEGFKLRPAWSAGEFTGYASVHAFKGMENKVVILTDVVLGDRDFDRYLFYTGMTRATESVRVLCDKTCQETFFGWFRTNT
jgi:hypothetical protein